MMYLLTSSNSTDTIRIQHPLYRMLFSCWFSSEMSFDIFSGSVEKMRPLSPQFHIEELGPVVQSIVSLTASLRRQFVKHTPTTYANTVIFFCLKNAILHCKRFSHFSNKYSSVFVIFVFEILTKR